MLTPALHLNPLVPPGGRGLLPLQPHLKAFVFLFSLKPCVLPQSQHGARAKESPLVFPEAFLFPVSSSQLFRGSKTGNMMLDQQAQPLIRSCLHVFWNFYHLLSKEKQSFGQLIQEIMLISLSSRYCGYCQIFIVSKYLKLVSQKKSIHSLCDRT